MKLLNKVCGAGDAFKRAPASSPCMAGTALAVRALHVLAAALLLGGALLLAVRREARPEEARVYEWTFWAAAGVLVATGIGNLGAFGGSPPGSDSRWGRLLLVKLVGVLTLLPLSMARTLLVLRADAAPVRLVRGAYAATAALAALVLLLGVTLAHG